MSLADKIIRFQNELKLEIKLPGSIQVMNPYQDQQVRSICKQFYTKYYNDDAGRIMMIGINPGRFGGGITGIPFTDPLKLDLLGIENSLPKKRELSSDFIYEVVAAGGGADKFYKKVYVTAVSPLGFVNNGKNLNYYDAKELSGLLKEFILKCMREQLSWKINTDVCFCLGEGENFKFLNKLNEEYRFFKKIISLPHPRFIMQYRRKRMNEFVSLYLKTLNI